MPHLTDVAPRSAERAYLVPWLVDREQLPWCTLRNVGTERVTDISTQFFGEGWAEPAVPRASLAPGEGLRFVFFGERALESGQVTVHWRRPDGREYAWTFVC
ncbi:hypothetical protein ET475_11385 [Microbacterium protaetiae]|uniref:Uncharacterized protein n=1 Tax=Microbacterium protaetiae TaxID=2509458 RepID=A0A4P6EE23_9MICO|nr:hypothetical protein [Microbacterium protaetiae]QAY60532.1 hypothetical protein ET475_11385 [Microbacterium protaetiae]